MTGPKSKKVVEKSNKYRVEGTYSFPFVIKDGSGCYLFDVDGKKYLDFNSVVCTNNVGYGNPEIKKVQEKYAKKGTYKVDGTYYYCEEAVELAEKVIKIAPKSLKKVFFSNSGAEAVENALKMAYKKKGPYSGISCKGAFHGRTLGALTYTESEKVYKKNFPQIPNHVIEFCTNDADTEINELDEFLKMESNPAFVIVEPVQGEGGYRPASKRFLKHLREVTAKNDIPLIMDEVQSGMGRTGKWWAHQHYGIEPDLMTAAKSLVVGATLTSLKYEAKEHGTVGSTWGGGHRVDLAVGLKVIEIIERDKLMKNAEKMGKYFMDRLKELMNRYHIIENVRGLGLMIGFELDKAEHIKELKEKAFEKGLLLLDCGEKSMRIAPPLIITKKEADEGLDIIEDCLKKLK